MFCRLALTLVLVLSSTLVWADDSLRIIKPKDNATVSRNPWGFIEFWWMGPNREGPYTLEISKDKEFKDLIYFQTVNRIHDFTRALPDSGKFFWRVKYKQNVSPVYTINIVEPKDHELAINKTKTKPFDIAKGQTGSITLSWLDPTKTGPYDVEVSPDPDFKTLVFRKRTRELSYTIDKFADAGMFFWRVRKGRIISPVGRFRINQSMVNAAVAMQAIYIKLQEPEDGDQVSIEDSTMRFAWEELTGKTTYRIEISNTGDFEKILFDQTTEETQIEVPTFAERGTYFWRVTSSRYESPVQSFILTDPQSILQKSLGLFQAIFFGGKTQRFWGGLNYKFSSLKGFDLQGSTSGTLAAKQFYNLELGYLKSLYRNWDFEVRGDFSFFEREPPAGFTIQTPVESLFGIQAGFYTKVLSDFRVGIYTRFSEYEFAKQITATFFEMDKNAGLSIGAEGEYAIFRYRRIRTSLRALFYSTIPVGIGPRNAFTKEFALLFQFPFLSQNNGIFGIFWEDIGVINEQATQNSEAVGLRLYMTFE